MTSRALVAATLALGLALVAPACGGRTVKRTTVDGKKVVKTPKLRPVKPEALREFDAGMRAMRLGGPEAFERAKPRLRAAVEIDGTLWEAWHNLGTVYWAEGDDDAAADAFGRALDVNPAHTPSLLARAEAHRRAGEFGKARKDYREALSRDPENAEVNARYASLLREQGKLEEAVDAARDALRYASGPEVYVELGLIYLAQGRDELAELVLKKALTMNEKLPAAWNALALVSLAKGDDQQAFERFDMATSIDPSFRDARFNKANVLLSAGDYAAAKEELGAVVQQDRDDFGAQVALGVAERGSGEYDRAKRIWEGVVKRAPRRSRARGDALFNLAVLEQDFGDQDPKRARAALDRYLQNAPKRHPKRKQAADRMKELGQ